LQLYLRFKNNEIKIALVHRAKNDAKNYEILEFGFGDAAALFVRHYIANFHLKVHISILVALIAALGA
jgi:hypothetical protein